ncbi:MAG TPA: transcription antitermination factor NusB [Patescibacteria group bacterium]|nr:transcription antitermination factor NusB [Patescibacteria group bacterium]
MSRRKAREMAVQTLFQLDFDPARDVMEALETIFDEREDINEKAQSYAKDLVLGTYEHLTDIDRFISSTSKEWKLERMPGVDRNIARVAIFEMKYSQEKLSPNVAINEAVELAKIFGTDESGRFINGILGALVKNRSMFDSETPAETE